MAALAFEYTALDEPSGRIEVGERDHPFAHIVRLMRLALGVPYSAVVLRAPCPGFLAALDGLVVAPGARLHPLLAATLEAPRGTGLMVPDVACDVRFRGCGDLPGAPALKSFAGVPLTLADGATLGVLYLGDLRARTFSPGDRAMLCELADCVTRELEWRKRATCDDLTGFLTRKPFFDTLNDCLAAFAARGTDASVAILDLDHFKAINDRHGHPVGDRVLSCVADVSRAVLGEATSYGRLGGEEFAFAFPGVSVEDAASRLCALREAVEAIRLPGQPDMVVTASVGVAGLTADVPTVSAWCKLADAALYGAKETGRNCVVVSSSSRCVPQTAERAPLLLHNRAFGSARPRTA